MGLCALLSSAKFVQMKYPSADSLNSAIDFAYTYDIIIESEGFFLHGINWELMQYPVYDFLNLFLAQGCIFESDRLLVKDKFDTQAVTVDQAANLRKYGEFFADFCIQTTELMKNDAHQVACAIIAFARRHLNIETIWTSEVECLTMCSFSKIKDVYNMIDQRYMAEFPDHAKIQSNFVQNRQRIQRQPSPKVLMNTQSSTALTSELSTGKTTQMLGSATTRPATHHLNSDSSKNCTLSNGKAIFECFKNSSIKKDEEYMYGKTRLTND